MLLRDGEVQHFEEKKEEYSMPFLAEITARRAALFALLLQSVHMPSWSFQGIPRLSPPLPALPAPLTC